MTDPEVLERITARRAELDGLEEQLAKQLAEVRAERDELAVAERILQRLSQQIADEASGGRLPPVVQVAGRGGAAGPRPWAGGVSEFALPPPLVPASVLPRLRTAPVMQEG
ncbi:hypothetical protein ACF05W_23925 [Streptomyces lydicus]|uniref:hypothetical protein n=1 Tax=Streptomyces lydicus TaxID=47763 RepID=UPI0037018E5B